jgi:hypothetical protein
VFAVGTDARSSSRTDFSSQCIKRVGIVQVSAAFQQELSLADHVDQLDASEGILDGLK